MIELTPTAVRAIFELGQQRASKGHFMRLKVVSGGCSGLEYQMTFDEASAEDLRLEQDTVTIIVDPSSFEYLKGCVVDFDDGLSGKGFEVRNPNAKSTCGCGRSFN